MADDKARRSRLRTRLALEALDDRLVPAPLAVGGGGAAGVLPRAALVNPADRFGPGLVRSQAQFVNGMNQFRAMFNQGISRFGFTPQFTNFRDQFVRQYMQFAGDMNRQFHQFQRQFTNQFEAFDARFDPVLGFDGFINSYNFGFGAFDSALNQGIPGINNVFNDAFNNFVGGAPPADTFAHNFALQLGLYKMAYDQAAAQFDGAFSAAQAQFNNLGGSGFLT
jgi:hypothetical protein